MHTQRIHAQPQIICIRDEKHQPFIDVFSYTPNNITQKSLGDIFGLFTIQTDHKDAAYIVNFLTSLVKKEYYSRPRRSSPESFETTLKKVNFALAEIAKEGNVSWLGTLDGVICSVSDNHVHFSTCGKGELLLIRNGDLLELSAPQDEQEERHPLKTFEDVASGKIQENDVFLAADRHLTELFSIESLRKEIAHTTKDELFRFIHTALINECSVAGALITTLKKDTSPSPLKRTTRTSSSPEKIPLFNAFGHTINEKPPQKKSPTSNSNEEKKSPEKVPSTYTDKKTGHIYIRQEKDFSSKDSQEKVFLHWKELFLNSMESIQERFRLLFFSLRKYFKKKLSKKKVISPEKISPLPEKEEELPPLQESLPLEKTPLQNSFDKEIHDTRKDFSFSSFLLKCISKILSWMLFLWGILKIQSKKLWTVVSAHQSSLRKRNNIPSFTHLLPNIRRVSSLFLHLNYRQRILALGILFLIVISPFLFNKLFSTKESLSPISEVPQEENLTQGTVPFWEERWEQEQNTQILSEGDITTLANIDIPPDDIFTLVDWDNDFLIATPSGITEIITKDNSKKIFTPEMNNSSFVDADFMSDLSLFFFLTEDKRIFSFSPVTGVFEENSFPLPENTNPTHIETYLTYLYIYDDTRTAVYRFPRIPGGFDTPISWLSEDEEGFSQPKNWDIESEIFSITQENELISFYQGRKTDFSLEKPFIPLEDPRDLFSLSQENVIAILDSENGRIILANTETGRIQKNIVSEKLIGSQRIISINQNTLQVLNESGEIVSTSISLNN